MITEKQILDALITIIDPDFNKDIVSLGFVRHVKIEGASVSFDIRLTTPACPVKDQFRQQAEAAVMKVPGVERVFVNMTARNAPLSNIPQGSTLAGVQSIIAVSSCKGGVGKSTVAAYLAGELAHRGFKVGLVDVDIHGPSVPSLFNLTRVTIRTNEHRQLIPEEKNGLKIMSFGFLLGDAPAVMRGPILSNYVQQVLHTTAWGELDYLFIDMPPGTGDIQLTITQTLQLSGAVIVTTPQTLSLIDVSRGILMFEKVNVPILGVIENMAYFQCDQCDKKHYLFGKEAAKSLQERFGIDLLGELPLLPQFTGHLDTYVQNEYVTQAVDQVMRSLGKKNIEERSVPNIHANAEHITLTWASGETVRVGNKDLRLSCKCALCVDEMTGEQILKEGSVKPDIAAKEIIPLGNYALGITWTDGHSSGIYPYKTIKELGKMVKNQER